MERQKSVSSLKKVVAAAFPYTIPVMTGYLFLGMAFGVLLQSKGYGAGWALLMSALVYAGSMQFVAADLVTAAFAPVSSLLITLMVNARHVFYGFSMLEKYRNMGRAKPYLIFGLTDETFSLLYSTAPPQNVSRERFYLCVSAMDQLYWIAGSVLGGLIGARLNFDVKGIEFVMTALFVSIFVEQCRACANRIPALVGLAGTLLCLLIVGQEHFLLAAMAVLVAALTLLRKQVERGMEVCD